MIPFAILLLTAVETQATNRCDSLPNWAQSDSRLSDLFDYDRPAESEEALMKLASIALSCNNRELAAASFAQAARAQAIQGKLVEARATLSKAAPLVGTARTRIKILLERGRIARREQKPEQARALLTDAFEQARREKQEALAADAAHMLALVEPDPSYLKWTERGLAVAEGSQDPVARRWVGHLAFNAGARLSESGEHRDAALMFARSLAARRIENEPELVAGAELALSTELAELGRYEDAEAIQRRLLREATANPGFAAEVQAQLSRTAKLRRAK